MAEKGMVDRVGEVMKAVLTELQAAGGEARLRDLFERAESKLALSEYEKATLEKSGFVRWHTWVHFFSIDFVKAGYITKSSGIWRLNPGGAEALKLPAGQMVREAQRAYRAWNKARGEKALPIVDESSEGSEATTRQATYDEAVARAREGIEAHINDLSPYDFQKLVAELLIAMGYHVSYVAPPGPDGGVDVVAYRDPFGTAAPRLKVQVKHRNQKVTVKEVRELQGVLKEGDVGLIVSSGGFTTDAEKEIRAATRHIEMMDLDRLIELWQTHYDHLREPGRLVLPLVKVHFLAPSEE